MGPSPAPSESDDDLNACALFVKLQLSHLVGIDFAIDFNILSFLALSVN